MQDALAGLPCTVCSETEATRIILAEMEAALGRAEALLDAAEQSLSEADRTIRRARAIIERLASVASSTRRSGS